MICALLVRSFLLKIANLLIRTSQLWLTKDKDHSILQVCIKFKTAKIQKPNNKDILNGKPLK